MLKVYADHSATTPLSPAAWEAMQLCLQAEYANASQPYSFSRTAKRTLRQARETIAQCLNAQPEEIYFTSGGTESNNWVLKMSLLSSGYTPNHANTISKQPARTVRETSAANSHDAAAQTDCTPPSDPQLITGAIEHHAVLNPCRWLEDLGFPIAYLPVDRQGLIGLPALKRLLQSDPGHPVRLVSVMAANNEIGTIQPLAEISGMAHEYGARVHSDAVPAVGHIPLDVQALGLDYLSASAHKFNGPKGIGFLYQRRGRELSPLLHGGAQENGRRAGTENTAAIAGMAAALEENCRLMTERSGHLLRLEEIILNKLKNSEVAFIRQGTDWLPGLLSLSFPGYSGEALLHRLDLQGISISTGSACDSQNTQISHVLKAIHLSAAEAEGTVRISLGHENSADEIKYLAEKLTQAVSMQT